MKLEKKGTASNSPQETFRTFFNVKVALYFKKRPMKLPYLGGRNPIYLLGFAKGHGPWKKKRKHIPHVVVI